MDIETQIKTRPMPARLLQDIAACSGVPGPAGEQTGEMEREVDRIANQRRPLVVVGQGDSQRVLDAGLAFESDDHSDAVVLYLIAALLLAIGFTAGVSFHSLIG